MADTILPPSLKPGDRVGIITSSAPEPVTDPEWFERGLRALKASGFEVVVAPTATLEYGYRAAPEGDILADFNAFVIDPGVTGIIFAGGGKNSNRLLGGLDFATIAKHPTVIVGVSDPTVVLNAITARTSLVTFHGPSVVWDWGSEQPNELTTQHFMQMVGGETAAGRFDGQRLEILRPGQAEGHLVAGCLSALRNLLGTAMEPNWNGAIFAWEDVSKPMEQLDATLTHFRDLGVLEKISGMVVGELVGCDDSRGWGVEAMVSDLCGDYTFPILTGLPFGHTSTKYTVPIGGHVRLDSDSTTPLALSAPWTSD